jgi:hypothetical protein
MERRLTAILAADVTGQWRRRPHIPYTARFGGGVRWRPGQDRGLSPCRQRIAVLELGRSK